ncbi:MAG TPA: TolC family protein [Chthoniobacterales bacterium]|nr:TolC family protein [Chthoniobacterales bacterium]
MLSVIALAQSANAITLDAVLDRTLEKNPAIRQAKANVEQAAGQRLVLRSIMWPDVKLLVPAGVQGGHRAGEGGVKAFGFVRVFFTQQLLNAAIAPSRRLGDVDLLIAQQQLNVAVVEQLHAARLAFYTALYTRELQSIQEDQRHRFEQNVASQKSRYEAGLAQRSDFVAATVEASELTSAIETAKRARETARLQLAEAMGENPTAESALPEPEGELQFAPVNIDVKSATARALEERADLKLARLIAGAANEQQRIIEAGYYPAVAAHITGDYIPVSGIHREGSTRRTDDFVGSEVREGAAYTWRLIDNGKVGGAVMKQRAAREMNELVCRQLEANVGRELSRIRDQLSAIEGRQKALAGASTTAEESAKLVAQNLAGGLASQLEYRVTQNGSLQTKSGLLTAIYEHNVARAEWDRATGRYFQFSDQSVPADH